MGEIQYRLVVEDPAGAAFAPGDLNVDDSHFWVTSRPVDGHAWIESPPDGEGQKLDLVTGKTSDGQYNLRVIDVPEDVCTSWTSSLVADTAGLGLTTGYLSAGWSINGTFAPGTYPNDTIHTWWNGSTPDFAGSVLFMWIDQFPTTPYTLGPYYRTSYIEKTITGLTPGATYGVTFELNWVLDTGPGNVFVEIDGASGPSRLSITSTGSTIWDITTLEQDQQLRLRATANGSGEITVRMGGENYAPSANVQVSFDELSLYELTCATYGGAGGTRYVTSWLADANARQQLLGRRAWLEQTVDDGASWDLLYAGYVTALEMPDSLVYDFSIGDTRRVERNTSAWRNIDPLNEPDFERMTALIGGPVYKGFVPHSPKYATPLFRVVDYQAPSGDRPNVEDSDGWVKLNYISGPMPPGFRHPASSHAANLVRRTLNDRAQPYYDGEGTWDASKPSGAFPGLRAALFDRATGNVTLENAVPLGQSYLTPVIGGGLSGRRVLLSIERGQEFINAGLEVVLRVSNTDPTLIVGDYYYLLITPRDVADQFPLFYRGHPVDLEVALLDRWGVPYNAASATTVKDALGADLTCVMRYDDPERKVQDVVDELHGFFGFATRINNAGEREFFVFRALVDTTPTLNITTDALRAEGGPTYLLDEGSRKNRVVVSQTFYRKIDFDDEDIIGEPSAVATVTGTQTFDYSSDGGATLDADVYGPAEATFNLTGYVAWKADAGASAYEASSPMNQVQWGQGVARQLFAWASRGVQEATIVTRRDVADADAARIGDPFLLDADHVPNAQLGQTPTAQRGGERWWRVIQRRESPEGAELVLADAGTGVAYGEVVTLKVKADLYDPGYFYRVEISNSTALETDGAWLELEVALGATTPTGNGVRYTILDGKRMVDSIPAVVDPFTQRIGPFPYQVPVWVRARAFLLGGAPGTWSAWTSLGGPVSNGTLANLVIYPVTTTTATLTWDNSDLVNQVRVQYRLNDTGAWTTFATLGATSTTSTITGLALDSLYGCRVVLWDGVAEVGTPLLGTFTTLAGVLSSLTITSIGASDALLQWGNTHPTFGVKVEFRESAVSTYGLWVVLQPTSTACRLFGLLPSTSYDVRVVLLDTTGAESGTALTGTFSTLAASATLNPPTNPAVFAGTDPASGGFSRGLYGLRVYADASNGPHWIVIEEAVETAVGSATPGTYSEVDFLTAQLSGATLWSSTAPNDQKLRYLRAKARAAGYSDSATTTALSIDPWAVQPPVDVPLTGTITLTQSLAEDASADDAFLIQPGATIYQVECTSSDSSRLQLYESASARTNDAGRSYVTLPSPGSGVLLDVVFPPGSYSINLVPVVPILDLSGDYNPTVTVYYRLTSYEPGTNAVTHVITYNLPSTFGGA